MSETQTVDTVKPEGEEVTQPEEQQPEKKSGRMYSESEFKEVIRSRDEAKRKARELAEAAEQSEIEKRKEQDQYRELYETEKEKRERIEAERADIEKRTIEMQKKTALTLAAKDAGMVDASDAALFVKLDDLTIDDSGNVVGVSEAMEALKESKAHLFAAQQGAKPHQGIPGGGGGISKEDLLKSPTKAQELYQKDPGKYREIMGII